MEITNTFLQGQGCQTSPTDSVASADIGTGTLNVCVCVYFLETTKIHINSNADQVDKFI